MKEARKLKRERKRMLTAFLKDGFFERWRESQRQREETYPQAINRDLDLQARILCQCLEERDILQLHKDHAMLGSRKSRWDAYGGPKFAARPARLRLSELTESVQVDSPAARRRESETLVLVLVCFEIHTLG
jgi:hypothetical protein